MEKPVYLLLENGDYFEGKSFGAPLREVTGEVVFTTGMTGYLETIHRSQLFWTDCRSDISVNRKLRSDSAGLRE